MAMIRARNLSSHTYNLEQAQAQAIADEVIEAFTPAFRALHQSFLALQADPR